MNRMYIPLEALEAYGESTGRSLPVSGTVRGRQVEQQVRAALKTLRRRRDSFHSRYGSSAMPEAARWLLDNFYLAQREGLDCCAAFHHSGRLPAAEGEALILALCRGLLSSGGGTAEEERCLVFLRGFQKKTILSGRELSLFAAALRAAAILQLAALYERDIPTGETVGALFGSLRLWSMLDLTALLEQVDQTEQILRQDPAEIYSQMDEGSRSAYRRQIQHLARQRGIPEHRAAQRAIRLAREGSDTRTRHVGYHLFVRPLGDAPRPKTGSGYIALQILLPVGLSLLSAYALNSPWAALLLWLPIWQATKTLTDTILSRLTTPRHLPRLALEEGVPEAGRTICVISTLLTGEEEAKTAARRMEEFYHASRSCGRALLFGLLCDLPEAEQAQTPADRRLLKLAAEAVETLNHRYGGGFYLLFRERSWSRDTGRFTGWERKRGALLELARLLAGEKSAMQVLAGDPRKLKGTRYILTLDADTRLLPDSARQLIGAAMHPLNKPVIDRNKGLVVAGHGVIHPRIATELTAAQATSFTRLFAPQGGTDPYGGDAGEVYMDLFASGGFAGKGILDIEAFLLCMDKRLPENTVLSHDALEGAFLRGGLMADTELTDGFPTGVLSYYKRQHRWMRGDWQNSPWLFRAGKDLPSIEKWRLFDSLRRSLTPVWTLTALLSGFFLPGTAMAWVSLLALGCQLLPAVLVLFQTLLQPEELSRLRLLSGVYHGTSAALMKAGLELLLLPYEAWICLSAVITALWRMLISHKNLLAWQTAAQTAGKGGLWQHYRSMAPAALLGLGCLICSLSVVGRAAGLLWLGSPAMAYGLCRPRKSAPTLSAADRDWLKTQAAAIWRYYRDFCTKADHYLPPDNFQDAPPVGLAHRTSPTNIGLGLVAALCAMDLDLAPRQEALQFMENMISTLEALPKWNGHLYNWYDTLTTRPLEPKYVSTVDSGNLAGCLLVLRNGLTEYNITETAMRVDALRTAMDFRPLYDESRHLFRIGLEPDSPGPAKSWYDLMESEERLTGYLAIASGQVPRKHWTRLSRAQVGCDGFRGMASWTGTMFEYLMPELFLPLYRDSLLYESARFALYVQRRRTAGPKKVWGSSESAFYALDAGLNYRYKAHGCPRLALCRGMEEEQVIAPYSSFLALKVSPRGAMANLRALEDMGMTGPYGFWEALDFTPSRADESGSIVRCVMAHHLGMSLAAITNLLLEDILPRRFMADAAMAAYAPLLQEKVPLGGLLLRRREMSAPPRRRFESGSPRRKEGTGTDWANPVCTALSNGVYSLLLTESGLSRSHCAGIMPYRCPRLPLGEGHGMEIFWQQGGETLSLLPDPRQEESFSWHLTGGEASYSGWGPDLSWTVTAKVSRQAAGELRQIVLQRENPQQEGRIHLRFEPVLAPEGDYHSQPAFCRLGIEARQADGILLIRRLPRGKQGELHMALACSEAAVFSADSHLSPRRGSRTGPIVPNGGWQSESCITAEVIVPPAQKQTELCFALCIASSEEEARRGAARMLAEPQGFDMARAAASALGLTEESADAALDMMPALVFPHVSHSGSAMPGTPRNELWALGISGDLPIVAVECAGEEAMAPAEEQLRRHGLLSACGVLYDLVFLTDDGGEYLQPRRSALESVARHMGRDTLIGARGGVHFAPLEQKPLFQVAAALYGGELPGFRQTRRRPLLPPRRKAETAESPTCTWNEDSSVTVSLKGTLPPRSWGNLLTNGSLSWFAADCGTGALWLDNARECPLTPWRGDPLAEEGPERLWVEHQGQLYHFFACSGEDCRMTFSPGAAVWEKDLPELNLRLTAFIPPEHNVRIFHLESSAPCVVRWTAPLQLAAENADATSCSVVWEDGVFSAGNPRCHRPDLTLYAACSAPWLQTATDTGLWLAGEAGSPRRCGEPGFAGSFPLDGEAVLVCGTEDVTPWLTGGAARAALEETKRWWQRKVFALTAETPDRELNRLLQGWAGYQALACRCMGRSSQYQSGGAMGFRDQLQDRVNLIPLDPDGCRAHIFLSCAHQFREGDVQHWWHSSPGDGADKGVRTRCSDDLLWLPWALCEYVEQTGDESLCAETAPWLRSPPLAPEEDSRYETPERLREQSSVLSHCRRALELVLVRGVGQHELLLMGSGDWNDGFDAMGEGAESVWLSWFFSLVAHKFAQLLTRLGEPDGEKYERAARALGRSADRAWSEDRYLRGYYGDGTPLGSQTQEACRIDSIAQSFAAFCPYADPAKVDKALDTALAELWDREGDIARLYAPSFTGAERAPGYVAGYGPGFRENGGQYTHAALWLAMACFRRNRSAEGAALLRCACASQRDTEIYCAEPFVIPADIYVGDQQGRAGWSWYTGSAGWFFSVAFRELLGFRLKDGTPELSPQLPPDWPGFTGRWVDRDGTEHFFGLQDGKTFLR